MTKHVDIPRIEPHTRPPGGGWYIAALDHVSQVHLVCAGCRRHAGTLDNHAISSRGEVTASLLCADCGWHVYGRLMDWPPGLVKRAGERSPL